MITAEYRYNLDTSSNKFPCPQCAKKTFVLYRDIETGEYLPGIYGRCDRESNCGYHNAPPEPTKAVFIEVCEIEDYSAKACRIVQEGKTYYLPKSVILETLPGGLYVAEYFMQSETALKHDPLNLKYYTEQGSFIAPVRPKKQQFKPILIPLEVFKPTLTGYDKNTFIQNLLQNVAFPFEAAAVTDVVQLYRLGTIQSGYRAGAITFPFIDANDGIRAVQVKQFNNQNSTTGTDFLHSIITREIEQLGETLPEWLTAYNSQDKRVSCLFGEHLLNRYPDATVYLFEAPKTAIYSALYFGTPQSAEVISLAVYNKSSLNLDKIKVLEGRTVIVFPDLSKDGSTFTEWHTKAKDFEKQMPGTRFIFSDLLERIAPQQDREEGKDLADYLIKLDWREFKPKPQPRTYTREQRISAGMQFPVHELAAMIYPAFNEGRATSTEIKQFLEAGGLIGDDVTDLIDVMVLQGIITATDYPYYRITNEKISNYEQ